MYKISKYIVDQRIYEGENKHAKTLLFSTRSSRLIAIDTALWERVAQTSDTTRFPQEIQDALIAHQFIVPKNEDELGTILRENTQYIAEDDSLYFVIQPTAACPLGCGYCGQVHTSKSMRPDVQDATISRISQKLSTKSYQSLSIGWFGAEPLSGFKIIDSLSPRLQSLAQQHGIPYKAKIVTNGLLLTPEIATTLIKKHQITHFEITLDGTKEHHDKRRFLKNGGPSFDKIYTNVKMLTDLSPETRLSIRCNVDKTNYEGVSPLINQLAQDGFASKVTMYVAPIHSWGNDAHLVSAEKQLFSQWEVDWLIELQDHGFQVAYLPNRKKSVCFALSKSAELIDPHGGVYKCSEVSLVPAYNDENGLNIHELGKATEGALTHPERIHTWGNFYSKDELSQYDCAQCIMLPTCGGGCPKSWKEGIVPCPSVKHNIKERMVLQYTSQGSAER